MLRGIDDKRKLLAFFGAKHHKNLVLRIADVLELRNEHQDALISLSADGSIGGRPAQYLNDGADGWRKRWLLREYPSGWMVMPLDEILAPLSMEEIEKLQEIVFAYAGIRLEKGEPCRVDPCSKCGGTGQLAGRRCKNCDGEGQVTTFIEMSVEERALAEGRA